LAESCHFIDANKARLGCQIALLVYFGHCLHFVSTALSTRCGCSLVLVQAEHFNGDAYLPRSQWTPADVTWSGSSISVRAEPGHRRCCARVATRGACWSQSNKALTPTQCGGQKNERFVPLILMW